MKKCLACSATFSSSDSCCLVCGSGPEMQEGFLAYAPALAQGGGGFKAAAMVTVKLAVVLLLKLSVAVMVTVVTPIGKSEPLGCE